MHRSAFLAESRGWKIYSGSCSPTSKRSKGNRVQISSTPLLPFSLPLNTPVLQRVLEQLQTMNVDQVALVEIVAIAIARGQL